MKILITGGAGFIGSNIARTALKNGTFTTVRVLDNLSTGHKKNIEPLLDDEAFEFLEGDICSPEDMAKAAMGMDVICHQAALGSVPRSIKEPVESFRVNAGGFLNVLEAARAAGIRKVVYASSSAVYGDSKVSPKTEDSIGNPLSPYASSKRTNELYAEVYALNYDMEIYGFRYFNVFGPHQDPYGPYAAVIPIFMNCALTDSAPTINGDGSITRDFTFVENVVDANLKAVGKKHGDACHKVLNIACGDSTSLNKLWDTINNIAGKNIEAVHGPDRKGDILHSLADVSRSEEVIDYKPLVSLEEGLKKTYEWYAEASRSK